MLTLLTSNISGVVRYETLHRREHAVVPLTLIVPGVLKGSKGPLYYPDREVRISTNSWNGRPVVVYHPVDEDGKATTANSPASWEQSNIGYVFNAKYDGKLVAEAWIDVDRANDVDKRILANVQSGVPTEISTGLFTEEDDKPGVFNGQDFDASVSNFRPDHLAILPDQVGACSISDGCGLLVNSSHSDIRSKIEAELGDDKYVEEVYDTNFIFTYRSKLWLRNYIMEGEVLKITDTPAIEVQRVTEYVAVPTSNSKEINVDKKEMIDFLIGNCECFEESDREPLGNLADETLTRQVAHVKKHNEEVAVANAAREGGKAGNFEFNYDAEKGEFITNEVKVTPPPKEPEAMDFKTFMAQAPPEVTRVVNNAIAHEESVREGHITTIKANEKNTFTDEQLKAMTVEQLTGLASFAAPEPTANYGGAGGAPPPKPKANEEEPLLVPTMNYSE